MNILEIILLPFIFIYKGFLSIILFPYNIIKKITKKDGNSNVINESKNNQQTKTINVNLNSGISSEPTFKTEKEKKEFEKLVAKARQEEEKRIKEQEKMRLDSIKKQELIQKRELEEQKKEDARIALEEKRINDLKTGPHFRMNTRTWRQCQRTVASLSV